MRDTALAAGFIEAEPVAAAQGWLAESGERADEIVVLDCGGGTVDWAYVRRENGQFRLVPACPPGGIEGLGGHDVDAALLDLLRERVAGDPALEVELERSRARVLKQVRLLKERVARGLAPRPIRIGAAKEEIAAAEVRAIAAERLGRESVQGLPGTGQ